MPLSKKRKKKRQKNYGPPPPKDARIQKQGLTKQKIIIYIISGVMILSLAASFIIGASGSQPSTNTQQSQGVEQQSVDGDNLLIDTPAPEDAPQDQPAEEETTSGSASEE